MLFSLLIKNIILKKSPGFIGLPVIHGSKIVINLWLNLKVIMFCCEFEDVLGLTIQENAKKSDII